MRRIRKKHIRLMRKTCATLGNVLETVTQEEATTLRDGPDGWTVLEVLGHLRDYNDLFHQRAQMMLDEDHPDLPARDHEALAVERRYNEQDLRAVYEAFSQARGQLVEFFRALTDEEWERTGVHPEYGDWTMTDAAVQVGHHDSNHIEQITRILAQG